MVETPAHASRCILLALVWLHKAQWGHGDIRWANVIQETGRNYRLIDLEYVVRLGSKPSEPFPHAWGENGEALEGGVFIAKSDLYMVGRLLEQANVAALPGAGNFMRALLDKKLSVEEALRDAWISEQPEAAGQP
jgi:hypothetical protein